MAAAKVAEDFAKENKKFEILGGAMGENALDRAGVDSRVENAFPRRAYCFDRGLHRGTSFQHRRCNWRTCKQHRGHFVDIEDKAAA